ncbi:MAG: hypothetical protein ACQES9_03345 [Myxococcota bacterium]
MVLKVTELSNENRNVVLGIVKMLNILGSIEIESEYINKNLVYMAEAVEKMLKLTGEAGWKDKSDQIKVLNMAVRGLAYDIKDISAKISDEINELVAFSHQVEFELLFI